MSLDLTFRWCNSIEDADENQWNTLTADNPTPFYDWDWLRLLEESGSISPVNGWTPSHLILESEGKMAGCAPLYVKTHSMGEFVYDFAWADVASQLNVPYYPKLVGTSPATPSGSFRFFCDSALPGAYEAMQGEVDRLMAEKGLGGVSYLFADRDWARSMENQGFQIWEHQSFLWKRHSCGSFEDYLAGFSKGQRRNIRREIASVEKAGIIIEPVWIEDTSPGEREFLYMMYDKTNAQFGPWAARFLTPEFFLNLDRIGGHRVLLFFAREQGSREAVALSLVVVKGNRMFGRYWGTSRFVRNLHFVLCYYEPIRYAIEHGIDLFDPGAGSPHKIRRGFESVATFSLHKFTSSIMNEVFARYIPEVNREEEAHIAGLNSMIPRKNTPDSASH